MTEKVPSVYLHIPFCASKCYYCDFNSYVNKEHLIEEYFNALKSEINKGAEFLAEYGSHDTGTELETIYVGGGTPTSVPPRFISSVVSLVTDRYKMTSDPEITIECNPGTVNDNKIKEYKSCGINRISIGLQSSSDRILKSIGRNHTYEDFLRTFDLFTKNGFENINVDIIEGLPGQSLKDLSDTVNAVISTGAKHVSVYSLSISEGSKFYRDSDSIMKSLPDDEDERMMYHYARKALISSGLHHYEISNFAIPGFESMHNLFCWKGERYLGFGAGAHSFIGNRRSANMSEPEEYIRRVENSESTDYFPASETLELLSDSDLENEFFLLRFRLIDGISKTDFRNKFGKSLDTYIEKLDKLISEGYLVENDDRLIMTLRGLDYANNIFAEFV